MHDASRTTSPSCAVGFRDRTAVVRATYPSPECRGFSPRQLHLCCGRCGSSFRSATDSLHPSAERASRHRTQDLTSPVARSVSAGSSNSRPTPAPPRRTDGHADRTRPVGSQCLLRPTRSPTETPLVGSIPTLPPGWRLPMVKRFSPTNRQPLAPLSRTAVQAGPSRSRPPRCRYSLSCPQHPKMLGRPSGRRCLSPTSATEQLSRAPWGTHAPERRARTLPTAASGAAPFRRLLCRRGNDPSFPYTEAPNDHEGHPTSSGAALGTARASWSPSSTCRRPDRGPRLFLSARHSSRSALSALHEVADQTPDAPCRSALPTRPSVAGRVFDGTKSPFHRRHANAAAFRARSVFHRRISISCPLAGA